MPIKKNTLLLIFLLLLLIAIAAFLRLYRIRDYLLFLGDQGRDVLIAKHIIVDHNLTLLGPTASVGGFYLGPFYYYLITLPLWLANFDPVGPAVMVALFGVATVVLFFLFTQKIFGQRTALFAALLYAFSPLVVRGSRFSWNPNVWPFFTLAFFYSLYWGCLKKQWQWFFLAGLLLGICFQLHYLTLIFIPLGFILAYSKNLKKWFFNFVLLFIGSMITFSPFLFFELRHDFPNFRTIFEFITRKQGAVVLYPSGIIAAFLEISERLFANFLGLAKSFWLKAVVYLSLFFLFFLFFKSKKDSKLGKGLWVIIVWWVGGGLFLRLYQGTIYDYYYGYLYPIPALVLGLLLAKIFKPQFIIFKIFGCLVLLFLIYYCLIKQPIWQEPNRMVEQTARISQSIIDRSQGKSFNFALISASNSDHAYRYFLEIANHKPIPLEERVEEQLFVVCESKICQPLGHPLWEIAAFGRAEIATEWQDKVGIRIFRLIHHPDSLDWIGKPAPKGQ